MTPLAFGVADKNVFRRTLLLVALSAVTSPVFAESIFLGEASLGDMTFFVEKTAPFAADMVFKWQVDSPQEYFFVDPQGQQWYIQAQFGIQRFDPPYVPEGATLRDITISLAGETGNLIFDRLITTESPWGGPDGYGLFTPITGVGSFTSISFRLGFEDVPLGYLGVLVQSVWSISSYFPSSFSIAGDEGSAVVVPEPSTYAMALAGIACGGLSMWRRRTRA